MEFTGHQPSAEQTDLFEKAINRSARVLRTVKFMAQGAIKGAGRGAWQGLIEALDLDIAEQEMVDALQRIANDPAEHKKI